jgi:hypothetical protein
MWMFFMMPNLIIKCAEKPLFGECWEPTIEDVTFFLPTITDLVLILLAYVFVFTIYLILEWLFPAPAPPLHHYHPLPPPPIFLIDANDPSQYFAV